MKPILGVGFDYFGVIGGIFGVNQKILSLAVYLKEKGYKIGVLSNISGLGTELMRKKKLTMFDVVQTSGDIGVSKPDKRAYQKLAESLGVGLDELLFIDDNQSSLAGVEDFGIRPVLFANYDKLVEELKEGGIII